MVVKEVSGIFIIFFVFCLFSNLRPGLFCKTILTLVVQMSFHMSVCIAKFSSLDFDGIVEQLDTWELLINSLC